jgi:hypothetical protein
MSYSKKYELQLTRVSNDGKPFNKNNKRYEVINLATVWKYLGKYEHDRSPMNDTGWSEVEFHHEGWTQFGQSEWLDLERYTKNKKQLQKKLHLMELLLDDYLNKFIIDKNEICDE